MLGREPRDYLWGIDSVFWYYFIRNTGGGITITSGSDRLPEHRFTWGFSATERKKNRKTGENSKNSKIPALSIYPWLWFSALRFSIDTKILFLWRSCLSPKQEIKRDKKRVIRDRNLLFVLRSDNSLDSFNLVFYALILVDGE